MTRIRKTDDSRDVRQVTLVGMVVNIFLTAGKFVAGFLGGSQALIADAVHSASDFLTDIAILIGSEFWNLPPDKEHPYGHRRFETLISIGIGLAVCGVGVGIGYKGLQAIFHGEKTHPEWIAAGMALVSVLAKEGLFHYTHKKGLQIRSQALEANAWHHRSDAFSSIPVVVAVVVAIIFPQFGSVDEIGAVVVSVLIFKSGIEIALPGVHQVADAGPSAEIIAKFTDVVLECPQVISFHDMRARYIGSDLIVDLHVVVAEDLTLSAAHAVAEDVESRLLHCDENVVDALVHIDPFDPLKA